MLFLETSQVPIKDITSVRRLLYLYEILRRPKNELIVQIYTAMKECPLKNDWIHLIYQDMQKFNIHILVTSQYIYLASKILRKL